MKKFLLLFSLLLSLFISCNKAPEPDEKVAFLRNLEVVDYETNQKIKLDSLIKSTGKYYVEFMSPICPHCIEQDKIIEEKKVKNVIKISVKQNLPKEVVEDYYQKNKEHKLYIFEDDIKPLMDNFNMTSTPTFVIVNDNKSTITEGIIEDF